MRSYTDKQNVKRTITEIVADEMQMLGGKNNSFQNDGQQASSAPFLPVYTALPGRSAIQI